MGVLEHEQAEFSGSQAQHVDVFDLGFDGCEVTHVGPLVVVVERMETERRGGPLDCH